MAWELLKGLPKSLFGSIIVLMDLQKKVLNTIKEHKLINHGEQVAVAVSGGADSVALLVILNNIKKELGFGLCAIHINHNIRGAESDRDEEFVKSLCKQLCLKLYTQNVFPLKDKAQQKKTLEQSARDLRYMAMNDIANKNNIDKIALAHHKGDQAETILMHLYRGSLFNGLIGMRYLSNNLIRPFLDVTKGEILEYLKSIGQNYMTDTTNIDNNYSRNFVRNVVLKGMEENNKSIIDHIVNLGKKANLLETEFNKILPMNLIKYSNSGTLICKEAQTLPYEVLTRLVRAGVEKEISLVDFEEKHINKIIDCFNLQIGKKINLPHELIAMNQYAGVLLYKKQNKTEISFNRSYVGVEEFVFNNKVIHLSLNKPDCNCLMLDLNKVPKSAEWRVYKSGDNFTKFGGGTKPLKEYFTGKKISARERNELLLLCDKNNVLAICGVEISEKVKVDKETKVLGYLWQE